mmetsp:Transcript_15004/g.42512  ORF Transcript_15004/g.42512 Transcript_15004/m.42512 type:complete len:443 (+) Transcript_15004:324-1652(+)|eukprot:CAMPEP_0202082888 /NCGR_PEP_ID=MMETSP0964-20121228/21449_1 /ASSEMBLY_ACC=CAM_ASM_000500 /TAXON_ID=4773 /ORGANISM="Schizochytrium aggregatum, Strain ATCC28209" /LENGTH=442 /DNA_ID=CAMNT_0048650547 /DNA_START=251 /DNA_END=1579 /DNA_ORIENTATION=+
MADAEQVKREKAEKAVQAKREKEERRRQWELENKDKLEAAAKKKKPTKAERREIQGRPKGETGRGAAPRPRNDGGVLSLFSHLDGPRVARRSAELGVSFGEGSKMHPAIVSLGLKYAEGLVAGANSRVIAMLNAFKEVIHDYETPANTSIARDLDRHLKPMIQFLIQCRPHSITMGNAIKHVRHSITLLPPDISETDAKATLHETIDAYINANILLAQEEIVRHASGKIAEGDTILTFGRASAVEKVLLEARERGTFYKVVVVSCWPQNEGQQLVETLAAAGVECSFIAITSLSYMMGSVDKVMLGASALFSNGAVLGRCGTALVAMMAKTFNKPVLVCAETHKFSDRVQLDSICSNELGDPDRLVSCVCTPSSSATETGATKDGANSSCLCNWRSTSGLELLNLTYDLTPPDHVSLVVTEFGLLPASSVPAIIREKDSAAA